ncbi:MAG TPA: beta-galactosidase [Candidatus Omnitrophota bacterium]|nr:beta-galactosidase [Candidatus Omnitrophota bacterium]HPT07333.1 beta-galactosidase [Candidatus Omnitrophota bacterium]
MTKNSRFWLLFLFVWCMAISAASAADTPFGTLEFLSWNHPWNNYKYPDEKALKKTFALMKEAGVSWVRMDFLWEDIEPVQGQIDYSKYDRIVDLATSYGIHILGIMSYSASWAGPSWNSPPDKDETFVAFTAGVIDRYKGKVTYWEIWNEPDDATYFTPQDAMVRYTELLKKVYTRAKAVNPECRILNGGLSKNAVFALKNIYKNGGKGYFDILAIHPFSNPLNEYGVSRVRGIYRGCRKIMRDFGDGDKKIWFTEIGCPGVKVPLRRNGWWEGRSPTEKEQAAWVRYIYSEFITYDGVEKIFWAFFRDTKDHFHNGVDEFGLVRWDFSKKPAFEAYRNASRVWLEEYRQSR